MLCDVKHAQKKVRAISDPDFAREVLLLLAKSQPSAVVNAIYEAGGKPAAEALASEIKNKCATEGRLSAFSYFTKCTGYCFKVAVKEFERIIEGVP